MIDSDLETLRQDWGEFLEGGKKIMTQVDIMICSQLDTLRDNMRLNVDEICQELRDDLISKVDEEIKASRQEDFNKDVKSVADQLQETYLSIQETVKAAKTTADKAHDTYLAIQDNKRRMIRGEDVEGFVELREEVRRMSIAAEIAAEELSRATVELVEAGIQQWEEDDADYLASLPILCCNHN